MLTNTPKTKSAVPANKVPSESKKSKAHSPRIDLYYSGSVGSSSDSSVPPTNTSTKEIMNMLHSIVGRMDNFESKVGNMESAINNVANAALESRRNPISLEDGVLPNLEQQTEDLTEFHIDPLVWVRSNFEGLKNGYNLPDSISNKEVLFSVSMEATKAHGTHVNLRNRVLFLLNKYRSFLRSIDPSYSLDDIKSKGFRKLMELAHMKSKLLHASLQHPIDLLQMVEINELVYLLCQIEKDFIHEGVLDSNFDCASDFLGQFTAYNSISAITEKDRKSRRDKHILFTKVQAKGSYQNQKIGKKSQFYNKGNQSKKFQNYSTNSNNNSSKSFKKGGFNNNESKD